MPNSAVELSVPANRDQMLLVRLATSGALARAGLSLDAHDDMKMAVEEACLCLIDQADGEARLSIRYEFLAGAARVEISQSGARSGAGDDGELDVIRCILEALAHQVDIRADENGIASIVLKSRASR